MKIRLGHLRRIIREVVAERRLAEGRSNSRFSEALLKQVEAKYGPVSETHYEDNYCEDGNGNLVSDPQFTLVTSSGLVEVFLSRDYKTIKGMQLR